MIKMMMLPTTSTTTTSTTTMPEVTTNKTTVVTFSSRRQVRPSLHIQDYSQEEIAECWYTLDELQRERERIDDANDGCCSLRGIERCSFQKKQIRAVSKQAVFKEQYRQFTSQEINDIEKIAQVYSTKTKGSQTLARILAQCDQEYVKGIQKQDNEQEVLNRPENYFPSRHRKATATTQHNDQHQQHQQQESSSSTSSSSRSTSTSNNNGGVMQPMMVSCCTSRAA